MQFKFVFCWERMKTNETIEITVILDVTPLNLFIYTFTQLKPINTVLRWVNINAPGIQVKKKGLNKEQGLVISENIC